MSEARAGYAWGCDEVGKVTMRSEPRLKMKCAWA